MLGLQTVHKPSRRDRIVVSTLRFGRSNPVRIRVTATLHRQDVLLPAVLDITIQLLTLYSEY